MTRNEAISLAVSVMRRQHKALATERTYVHWLGHYIAAIRQMSEAVSLRVKDLHLTDSKLFVMGGKGHKDRVVRLPCALSGKLEEQLQFAKALWQRDAQARLPIQLPHQLARKYPEMQFAWQWAWVFPMRHACADPRDGRIVRWHMLTDTVQRSVKAARRKLGIMVVPHQLRHAYATHSLERGVNMKALQEAMGHVNIETTSGYCHATALSVPSPLDRMEVAA